MPKHHSEDYKITAVKHYVQYAYQKETYPKYVRSKSTLRKKPKNYKLHK